MKPGYYTKGKRIGNNLQKFVIGRGEKVKELLLWGGYYSGSPTKAERVQGIKITMERGAVYEVLTSHLTGDPYSVDVGSGLMMGVFGTEGNDIGSVGFAFLRRAENSVLTDVYYPQVLTELITSKPSRIDTIKYDNTAGTQDQTYMLTLEESVTESAAWSVTTSLELGFSASFSVKAGFLFAKASSTTSFSLSVGVSTTFERENEKTFTKVFQFPITVGAGESVVATATIYEGKISTPYTGTVVNTLSSGQTFNYTTSGVYSGVTTSASVVQTETV